MLKILLVDDHAGFRNLVRRQLLEQWPDAQVRECDPCAEGLTPDNYSGDDYSVVLLDYQLGPQNGFDYLKRFRRIPGFPPVIMLTGEGNERLAVDAIRLGAADYIPKQGLTHEILVKAVQAALDARGSIQDMAFVPERAIGTAPPHLKDLKVVRKLADGGMSSIFLAERVRGGAPVVLKVFDAVRAIPRDPHAMHRFSQEYDILHRLNHPGIARIYEQGFTDEHAYITMEYFPRGSLRDRLERPLDAGAASRILRDVLDALEAVHASGIVHRDLKPGNIMFREDGSLGLIDFGIAKQTDEAFHLTRVGTAVGTPHYISPEQADGQPADARSDLYSLGVMLFEMLSGCVPYTARTPLAVMYKHKHAPIPVLEEPHEAFQPLLDRLLAKEPGQRLQTVAEVRTALAPS